MNIVYHNFDILSLKYDLPGKFPANSVSQATQNPQRVKIPASGLHADWLCVMLLPGQIDGLGFGEYAMLEKMDCFFENRLTDYDEHMLTAIEGAAEFYPFTAAQLPLRAEAEILDLGCGTGLELEAYLALNPAAHITGIDLSNGMLAALKQKFTGKKLHLICGSYFDIPLGENRFDAAVSVESLHHFTAEQKQSLYTKVFNALKTDGYFVLTDYFAESDALEQEYFETLRNLKAAQGISDNEFYHYDTPLTIDHEINVLKAAGFSQCEILKHWGATFTIKSHR